MQAQNKGHNTNREPGHVGGIMTSEVRIDNQELPPPDKKSRVRKIQDFFML